MAQWTLYYDGGCNLCHTSKLKIEKWAEKAHQPLHVDVLQSDEGIRKGYSLEGMILEIDGKPHIGYDAWLESMKVSPWYLRGIYVIRNVQPFRWFFKVGYGFVAKYRLMMFGTRSCEIPLRKPTEDPAEESTEESKPETESAARKE
jgi:predicted DCC family thiol-disulfide oxidoreductase YuxK